MSWLRNSPLRQSFRRTNRGRLSTLDSECDPKACFDSFCKHWQQAYEIILKGEPNKPLSHDDVLGVVNHLDHIVELLFLELQHSNRITLPGAKRLSPTPCLEYLLSENLLDKLYQWSIITGRYANALRLEQLKVYERLVSHELLVHEPFLRPLLKILESSQEEILSRDEERRLVLLLNQLCVVLMGNINLLDRFLSSSSQHPEHGTKNFIIFSLLIPYVHREGSLGHQARDALLLCMSLSQKNSDVGMYIANHSSMCPVLVTGLGGLYSRLPNIIEISTIDWYRITSDDVVELSELTMFINSLEFCNAVVQVAHSLIRQQLIDFMYQGFIVPVLGPALLQLCMVTLSLFDTLLSLNCEDLMLELLLKFLLPGKHVPISHRHKINKIDPYASAVEFFMNQSPEVMKQECDSLAHQQLQPVSKTIGADWNHYGMNTGDTLYGNYHAYLYDARHKIEQCKTGCEHWSNSYRYQRIPYNRSSIEKSHELIRSFLLEFGSDDTEKSKQMDSLQSLGESSGYESFRYRPDEELLADQNEQMCARIGGGDIKKKFDCWKVSNRRTEPVMDLDFSEDLFTQGTVKLGPFLTSVWGKLQTFTSNCLYVNLHLTGLITRLACFPLPLIHSLLLRPDIPTTSDAPSFHQVLKILKQQIDAELAVSEESLELVDGSRSILIDREFRLVNARKNAMDIAQKKNGFFSTGYAQTVSANISATTPPQLTPTSLYDPFNRGESKRGSISNLFSNIFKRPVGSTGSPPQNNIPLKDTTISSNNQPNDLPSLDSSVNGNTVNIIGLGSMSGPSSLNNTTSSIGQNERLKDLAVCAVILDEWLKELAALSQEQSVVMLVDILENDFH